MTQVSQGAAASSTLQLNCFQLAMTQATMPDTGARVVVMHLGAPPFATANMMMDKSKARGLIAALEAILPDLDDYVPPQTLEVPGADAGGLVLPNGSHRG